MDPTQIHHFGTAVQSDILRQAALDRQGRKTGPEQGDDRGTWLGSLVRRLLLALRATLPWRRKRGPQSLDVTAPHRAIE